MAIEDVIIAKAGEFLRAGTILDDEGHLETAVSLYEKVLESNPENTIALNNIGCAFIALERYDEAVTPLIKIIEIEPENLEGNSNLGQAYRALERYDDAITFIEKAIAIDSMSQKAHDNFVALGCVYNALEKYDDAIEVFTKATEIGYLNPKAYGHMGYSYMLKGDAQTAETMFKEAISVFEQNPCKDSDKYVAAIRAERGLVKLGIISVGIIEQEAITGGILTEAKLTKYL